MKELYRYSYHDLMERLQHDWRVAHRASVVIGAGIASIGWIAAMATFGVCQ